MAPVNRARGRAESARAGGSGAGHGKRFSELAYRFAAPDPQHLAGCLGGRSGISM